MSKALQVITFILHSHIIFVYFDKACLTADNPITFPLTYTVALASSTNVISAVDIVTLPLNSF